MKPTYATLDQAYKMEAGVSGITKTIDGVTYEPLCGFDKEYNELAAWAELIDGEIVNVLHAHEAAELNLSI